MRNGARTLRVNAALALVAVGLARGCEHGEVVRPSDEPAFAVGASPAASQSDLMSELRQATARFHSLTQARKEGYVEASECVAVPGLGGMGHHWVNGGLVDPVFDPTAPEAVLYEPDAEGNYHLVAVEYIVIDVGQPAPTFDDQPFDIGGTPVPVDHWSLHIWLYKTNPNGVFTPFNPDVSCPTVSE
jgi:hypothetical protein